MSATTTTKPAVKVKTVQAPLDEARRRRPVPSNRPVIVCSVPGCDAVVMPDGDDGRAWTYKRLRAAARKKKWTKDELGLDCCPDHPKGHVPEPPTAEPAAEGISEVLDGEVVSETSETTELPPLAAIEQQDEAYATYAYNRQVTVLAELYAADDDLDGDTRTMPAVEDGGTS